MGNRFALLRVLRWLRARRRIRPPQVIRARPVRVGWRRVGGAMALLAGLLAVAGCEGDAGRGALIGGGLGLAGGTIVGHQSGHSTEGAIIGGLLGAATGSAIGSQRELERERERGRYAYESGYGRGYDDGYYESRRPVRRRYYRDDDYCDD
jgi:hypothetical protein